MKPRTLIVLATLALCLGGYILLVESDQHTSDELRMQQRRVVPKLNRDVIRSINVKWPGRSTPLDLRRQGDSQWRVGQWRADPAMVDQIISGVEFLEYVRTLPPGSDRERMGLTSPVTLTLDQGSGPKIRLLMGGKDPSGQGVYLEHGSRLLVVPAGFLAMLQRSPGQLRDSELVPLGRAQIRRVKIRSRDQTVTVERPKKTWTVTAGASRVRAKLRAVDRLLLGLSSLRAARFLERGPAAGAGPWIEVRGEGSALQLGSPGPCPGRPTERAVQVGEREGKGPWRRSAACVPKDDLAALEVTPAALMDLAPTTLSAADLARVVLQRGGRKLTLTRVGGRWLMGKDRPADADVVRKWAERLAARTGKLWSQADGDEPLEAHLALTSEDKTVEVLHFFRPAAGRVTALRHADGAKLVFPESILTLLITDPLAFRQRQVLKLSPYDVVRLSVTRQGKTRHHARTDDGWKDTARAPTLDAAVNLLAALRAQRFLATAPTMEAPVTLTLTLAPSALKPADSGPAPRREVKLRLGSGDVAGGCPATTPGQPPFWLPAPACKILLALISDR